MGIGCSTLRQEDPEKNVRLFLTAFQNSLAKSDDEALANFQVKQTREAVITVLDILRNKDPFIVCDAAIASARIMFEQNQVKVEIPTTFRVKELNSDDHQAFTLVLWLTPTENSFQITQLEGEAFYQTFMQIKNSNQWEAAQKLALQERLWIYENARKLEATYDSVIWYTTYDQQNYYYVVEGTWYNFFMNYETREEKNKDVRMGLIDGKGEIIIPMEYDLIGTIAIEHRDLVEVKKDGKLGYYDIKTKQLVVRPMYDLIIPYNRNDVWAVVKKDTTIGWLNQEFQYQVGFPSPRVERWYYDFEFLKQNIRIAAINTNFCEIPSPPYAGNGIVVPPSYLTKYGIFDEIEGGISTTSVPMNAWTEYKEITGSFFEVVTENISAVVTSIRERYLEGREEFYDRNSILFVNHQHDTLGTSIIPGQVASLRQIDSTLLEVKTPEDQWFWEYQVSDEFGLLHHNYFVITASGSVQQLTSNRIFPQTEFVKLDSTYLTGKFTVYNESTEQQDPTTFLSINTITYMRDEILASYGYQFPESEKLEHFKNNGSWYKPQYSSLEEFESSITEIDKHNLAFLNKILELLQSPTPA